MAKASTAIFNDHVAQHWSTSKHIDFIRANHIKSYEDVFALIKDDSVPLEVRIAAYWFLRDANVVVDTPHKRHSPFDKRRIVPALLAALKTSDQQWITDVLYLLGLWRSKIAVPALLNMVTNRDNTDDVRSYAIYVVASIDDQRAVQPLTIIANDLTEPDKVRGDAIEQLKDLTANDDDATFVRNCIRWLSDESAEVRFWASFGLVGRKNSPYMVEAIPALDHVVGNDHTLPKTFWHVDREAVPALEGYFCVKLLRELYPDDEGKKHSASTCLVSASLEYTDYRHNYQLSEKKRTPKPITTRIDPAEFAVQLQARWPDIKLNVRSSELTCYLLDWQLVTGDIVLIGGLFKDRYALAITSNDWGYIREFAAEVNKFIPKRRTLYFYEWAGRGSAMKFWTD